MTKKVGRLITTRPVGIGENAAVRFTDEALQGILPIFNGSRSVRQGVNHDPRYVPLAKTKSAWTVPEDGFTSLFVEVDDTHATKRTKFKGHKSNLLTLSFPNDPRPFVLAETPPGNRVSVMTDPRNFGSVQQHEEFQAWVTEYDETIEARFGGRFAEIPEPLIQFIVEHREALALISVWLGNKAWKFVDRTVDSAIEHLADQTGLSLGRQIADITKKFCSRQHDKTREVTQHITLKTDPEINFITRSKDLEQQLDLDPEQIRSALGKYEEILKAADSIALSRENQSQEWKLRYATTKDGEVITTKVAYRETVLELERIRRSKPICVCMKNRETGEEYHHETTAEFTSISEDSDRAVFQMYFETFSKLQDPEWEVTAISLAQKKSADS